MKKLLTILRFVVPYWSYAALNIAFNILSVLFSLVSFAFFIPVFDILFNTTPAEMPKQATVTWGDILSFDMSAIKDSFYYMIASFINVQGKIDALFYISIFIAALFFFKNVLRYFAMFFLATVRNGVVKDLRNSLYYKILILPLSFFSDQKKGDIISRMTADVQEIEWSIMSSLEMIFREPITLFFYLLTLFYIHPQLTLFVLILLPLSGYLIGQIGKSLKRTSVKSQKKLGEILSVIEETISGLRIIKAFNAIDFTYERFREINRSYTRVSTRLYRKRDLASPLSEFLGVLVLVVVLWFGGKLVISSPDSINGAVFIVYLGIFSQLIAPAKAITQAFYNIQKGTAAFDRIQNIMNAPEVIEEKTDAIPIAKLTDNIHYKDVSFTYDGRATVLDHINLEIKKGQTLAIVGPSGSGKSTLVDLLPRFYDCTSGAVMIDGQNIRDYRIDGIRSLMGIVSQDTILFNDTVFSNIAFGVKDVSHEKVVEAAKAANAHDFIMQMENGYDTIIGDRGIKLSGGQRQRISIARAILKDPDVLILDEATSALDTESERLVQEALVRLLKNRTSLVIAHRLSTVHFADEIIVLDKGRIAERGAHSELIAMEGLYKRLYDLQNFSD